jgi:drug/metabolite transporter (DMT)-like permease
VFFRGSLSVTIVIWWLACLIWSSVWLFIKIGLRDLPPITFAAVRLVIALAVLLPILAWRRREHVPRDARDWYVLAVSGILLLGVNYALLFWGAQFIPSGLIAVLGSTTPAFALVFGHFLLDDEPFTVRALGAIAIGVAGVALISRDQLHIAGRQALLGCAAVTAASAFVAFAYVFVKRHRRALRPEILSAGQMLCAVGPMLVAATLREGNPLRVAWTPAALGCLLYLALVGSIAGTWLNYWLLERISATALLSMGLIEPLIAVLLGWAFLHERISPDAAVGGALILCSIFMITIAMPRVGESERRSPSDKIRSRL